MKFPNSLQYTHGWGLSNCKVLLLNSESCGRKKNIKMQKWSTVFTANFIYYRGWQEVTGENLKVA